MKAADRARLCERLLAYFRGCGCEVEVTERVFGHGPGARAGRRPRRQVPDRGGIPAFGPVQARALPGERGDLPGARLLQ